MRPNPALLLAGLAAVSPAVAQDAASGEKLFTQNCAACHSVDPEVTAGQGPGLWGVVGRHVGQAPGFGYSDTLTKESDKGTVWTPANLDRFLSGPNRMMPGTMMPVTVARQGDRADLIAYLATLGSGQTSPVEPAASSPAPAPMLKTPVAKSAYQGWVDDAPGKTYHLSVKDLPPPYATLSTGHSPKVVAPPDGAMPKVPGHFAISLFAKDVDHGRLMLRAPNGDIFVSETNSGRIRVLRSKTGEVADINSVFAERLDKPFGMAFYPSGARPRYLYVANINSVVRFAYTDGDLKASGAPETIIDGLSPISGSHTTRSLVFTPDDRHLLVAIGSATNIANTMPKAPPEPLADWEAKHGLGAAWGDEEGRAMVAIYDPDGSHRQTFATGLRNCVGLVIHPISHDVLCATNERDELGDDLPPDYVTRVRPGQFFGWPWYYLGAHEDPRLAGARPDLKDKVTVPDVLLQAHSAPVGMVVYDAPRGATHAFPANYDGDLFVALHGSWNRAKRTGSKVVRIPMKNGVPIGGYEDFLTGLNLPDNTVWGRPSGVAVARDGSLLVIDDAGSRIWRVVPQF